MNFLITELKDEPLVHFRWGGRGGGVLPYEEVGSAHHLT